VHSGIPKAKAMHYKCWYIGSVLQKTW